MENKVEFTIYIGRIAHSIRYINDLELQDYGISSSQAQLLGALDRIERNNIPLSRNLLRDIMGISGPSVSSLLKGLERSGFIVRGQRQRDARQMVIAISRKGHELIETMNQVFFDTQKQLLKGMSDRDQEEFLRLLTIAHENINVMNEQ